METSTGECEIGASVKSGVLTMKELFGFERLYFSQHRWGKENQLDQ